MEEILFEYGFESVNGIVKKVYSLSEIPNIAKKCDVWNVLPIVYVRQFTGLTDKNEVKIFEGDEVKSYFNGSYEYNAIVERDTCNPCFILNPTNHKHEHHVEFDFIACGLRVVEVIGNIHDK